jgi:RimJ/RimL family protein N-acetyltransferase
MTSARAIAVQLRPFRAGDEAPLVSLANDREIWRFVRDAFPHPYTHRDAERWIAYNDTLTQAINFAVLADGELVGGIGVVPGHDVQRHSAEIGYWIGRRHWGRGIATAAVAAMTEHAFGPLDFVRLHAGVFVHNPASARVLEKCGFEREGVMRKWAVKDGAYVDAYAYACLRG